MFARSHADLHNIRLSIDRIKNVSDRIVGVGPVGIGLDGILAMIPGVGALYSVAAGGMLIFEGIRARAASGVLIHMTTLIVVNTLLDVPGGNPVMAVIETLFTGHKWAANLLEKHMDETIYIEGTRESVKSKPEYINLMGRVRAGQEKRRIVFLG